MQAVDSAQAGAILLRTFSETDSLELRTEIAMRTLVALLLSLSLALLIGCGGGDTGSADAASGTPDGTSHSGTADTGDDPTPGAETTSASRSGDADLEKSSSENTNAAPENEGDGSPPLIKFKDKFYDFGTQYNTATLRTTFSFTNEGGSDLIIERLKSSCSSCTVAEYSKEPIPPGGTGYVKIQLVSDDVGKRRKSVDVYCNGSPHENGRPVRLMVEVNFKKWFWIEPASTINMGKIMQGESFPTHRVQVSWLAERDMTLEVSTFPEGLVHVKRTPFDAGLKKGENFEVSFGDSDELLERSGGSFVSASLNVLSSIPEMGNKTIRFTGTIHEDVVVTPRRVVMKKGATPKAVVKLAAAPNYGLTLDKTECTINALDVSIQVVAEGSYYKVTLAPRDGADLEATTGELSLFTNYERRPVFKVPIEILD